MHRPVARFPLTDSRPVHSPLALGCQGSRGEVAKGLKVIRLLRLGKMLRLARFRRCSKASSTLDQMQPCPWLFKHLSVVLLNTCLLLLPGCSRPWTQPTRGCASAVPTIDRWLVHYLDTVVC